MEVGDSGNPRLCPSCGESDCSHLIRIMGDLVPNQPRDDNPARTIRVEKPLWDDAKATAKRRDETVSEAVRMFLETYTDGTEGAIRRLARWLRGGEGR